MTQPFLDWRQDGGVVTLTMNRPEVLNALLYESDFTEFETCFARAGADKTIACIILTGAGRAFCAGGNVSEMAEARGMFAGDPMTISDRYRDHVHRIPRAFERLDIPVIAAVNGPAVGAGCDLACMCDLRVASTGASFSEVFVKLGLIPGDGGVWFLNRAIGPARAAQMIFTGAPVSALDALNWGLVSSVVDDTDLADEANRLAGQIAANPPGALRLAKRLLNEAPQASLSNLLAMSAAFQAMAHHSEAHRGAATALAQRLNRSTKP